jgi:hypothetical protein
MGSMEYAELIWKVMENMLRIKRSLKARATQKDKGAGQESAKYNGKYYILFPAI